MLALGAKQTMLDAVLLIGPIAQGSDGALMLFDEHGVAEGKHAVLVLNGVAIGLHDVVSA